MAGRDHGACIASSLAKSALGLRGPHMFKPELFDADFLNAFWQPNQLVLQGR